MCAASSAAVLTAQKVGAASLRYRPLHLSGIQGQLIGYDFPLIGNVVCPLFSFSTTAAHEGSPGPPMVKKRVAGIEGGGHLVVTGAFPSWWTVL